MSLLVWILIILLVLSLLGGGWAYPHYGYVSASPLVILVVIIVVIWATGNLH